MTKPTQTEPSSISAVQSHMRVFRDRPEQELTFPFSLLTLENYSAHRATPRLTARDQFSVVDLSQSESGYWYEMNSEEGVDAAEGVDALPEFQRAFGYAWYLLCCRGHRRSCDLPHADLAS
ncbi:hypothetical protein NKH49_23505 [Mesorhizobium sp. M1088]|uniref:hypothetical protein n=1 Tax=Mesorhizobium sp. M1088 TaxID=2957056 RepID=UPI00333D9394